MIAPALLLPAFMAAAPGTGTAPPTDTAGARDTAHSFLACLKEMREFCFETDASEPLR